MSSKAQQPTRWRSLRALRGVALVFSILAALFATAQIAEAAGTPNQLIMFTDKKVYTDWVFSQDKRNTNAPNIIESATQYDLAFYVYAVVLDDDGNIMKGRTSYLSGTINDIAQLDHYNKGSATTHHSNVSDPNLISGTLSFKDDGTVTGDVAGDGIYTAVYNPTDFADAWGTSNVAGDDHYKINVTVTDSNMGKTVYTFVLLSGIRCHQGFTHGSTHMDGIMPGGVDNCAVCHPGYEHFYESISGTIPESMQDVHSRIVQEPSVISDDKGFGDFVWNTSYTQASSLTGVDWKTYWPGSGYCPFCHTNSAGTVLDYSGGDRTPAPLTRPSCGETSGYYGSCHINTEMAGTPVADWLPPAGTMVKRQNYNISLARSHNHTSNQANVSCAICHGGSHALTMPNMSADISSSGNLNDQCVLCHNITGGLNITANGGRNENHTNPNCKACHLDQSVKMDSHLVPTAGIPNANCTECHDLGGISPNHIDFSVFNRSDYVHNQYNASTGMRPLNYNASNGAAVRPSENKICWGCHGDDLNNDGKANFSEQPANGHPGRYRNARLCEECHQNASSPWDAPQNVAHSYNTMDVRTPGAPNCYDCHGQPVMFNNSHEDADFNESNEKGVKASVANHYGTGFPPLAKSRGSNGYCIKYCHQNSSSPFALEFYNKENMQRPNHSAMTSRPQNQSCRLDECHAADAIHDEKMRKPTLANGTFGNGNCTAPGCHSPSDSGGFNYSYHNNVVNCTSCHMDNIGANIHPIKYLQNDGTDFAQVNFTAASCKLCHKNSQGDAVMNRWGVTPRKVGSQHHSGDPENGSKWNKTIEPYWDYVPNQITFVNGWVNNSYRGFIKNFEAMKDTNSSAGTISENVTDDVLVGHYPSNHDFNITVQSGGWYPNGTATTKSWSNLPADGNPNGSLIVSSTTKNQIVDAVWTASFVYNKTAKVADAAIRLDSKLIKAKNINTASLKAINVTIEDKYGNTTEVFNRSLPDVPEVDWSIDEKTIPNPDAVFWKNASLDHTYNVSIRTRWTGLGGSLVPDIKVAYDNVFVNLSEVDYKKYNFTFYINDTPSSDRYNLIVGYQTHVEKARLYVLNGSSFKYRADLDSGAFTKVILPLSKEEYGSGNITLRINDSNGPGESPLDVNEIDVKPDYIDIDYMFIDSFKWINNSRVNYPCEYCHAPNKHFQHALGVPTAFMGNNSVGQNVNSSTTWCASCHYQGYISGSNNYTDMIEAFLDHMLPVPPEITGHSIYGVNKSQSLDYYEHSQLSSFDDKICWNCHKGNMEEGSTSTQFLHNVSAGTAGGVNCTACHGPGGSATGMLVNFTSVGKGMHASLNKNAYSTPQNASNKPCWGCHGTQNGTWANETDQPLNDHNTTFKGSARKCHDCHNDSQPLYGAKNVTDHIPSGLSGYTDVSTSRYNVTYCAYCHNNSIVTAYDPDDLGSNPMNASASHYGANRTANKLMSPGINSTDCVFCHRNTSNMLKWGILPGSTANISNKNASGGGTDHSSYTENDQCSSCHGGYIVTQGFTFHNTSLGKGAGGGSNCTACHNVDSPGTYPKVDFSAINVSIHGNLNGQATSSPENTLNKPCWGCHGTKTGAYANESDQPAGDHDPTFKSYPRKCDDCHINGSIQFSATVITEHIMPEKSPLTEINVTEGYCSVCHNNSITVNNDSDSMGIFSAINASAAHYSKDANINLMTATAHSNNCTYCHFINNGSNAWLTPRKPLTSEHSSYSNDTPPSTCWGCHVDSRDEPSSFHIQAINKGTGSSPDCRSCHNISDTETNRGHIDMAVFNTSIHGNMNTTGGNNANEPCWGCHGNGNSEGHNTTGDAYAKGSFRNPYNCTDCHVPTGIRYAWAVARNAMTVSEHYANGTDIRASYNATAVFSCLKCHQDISEMLVSSSDTDTNRTVWTSGGDTYNTTIGGNNSPYHYGKKRPDIRSGVNASCSYCHQNLSSVFPLIASNKNIQEHTEAGGNITARACTNADCHAAGLIHNSTLTKPQVQNFTTGKYDYCAPCHQVNGFSTKKVLGHNTTNISSITVDCGYCHNASSQGQVSGGALRIHSPLLTNRSTANATCVLCHRDTKYVPANRIIKTHYPGAAADKGNTSESGRTCEACHGEVGANKLHQSMIKKPVENCQSCHLTGFKTSPYNATTSKASIVNFQHDNSSHAPTNQTNCERCHNTTNREEVFHFTEYANGSSVAPGWTGWINGTQANCIDCHMNNTNKPPFYAEPGRTGHDNYTLDECYHCHSNVASYGTNAKAMHRVDPSPANANCTLCHDITGDASRKIDVQAMNRSDSIHLNLNKDAAVLKAAAPYAADSKRCWACHGNGTEPEGHPTNFKNAFKCVDCHVTSGTRNTNFTPNDTILIVTEHTIAGSDIRTQSASYCTDCHNKTEMLIRGNDTVLSLTNPANDSVAHTGRKRGDIRSGQNTSCSYCHQNISTAFENVMTNSFNKSILEHTAGMGGNTTNSTLSCTGSNCHAGGFIHNSTLSKPDVQVWTPGGKDYCAPCHIAGNINATIYVYAHNTSNISVINTDCGYCHNGSSQGIISTGALRLHTGTLTNASTVNSSCTTCHKDSTYVGTSRVINTHYPDAPAGKANTSRSSWDCEECHGWSQGAGMHSPGLIKKPNYDCNACHNSAGGSPNKAYATPFVNLTRHDNTSYNGANVNCNTCHNNTNRQEPFHFTPWSNGSVEAPGWAGWTNGTRANCIDCHITYASQAPFYAEPGTYPNWHRAIYGSTLDDCYQCHSNLTILSASNSKAPVEMHNVTRTIAWNNCNLCHSNKYGGANRVDNASLSSGMHAGINGAAVNDIDPACRACHGGNSSVHRNSTANDCTYCHITGTTKYGAKNVSEHIPNGTYSGTQVNTSRYQQVYCDLCHNNSIGIFIDETPGSRNATSAHYGQNNSFAKLMNSGVNSSECMYCHRNTSNMEKWGISQTSNANIINREDHSSFSSNVNCYDCHVDTRSMPQTFHANELNEGSGSSPNCLGCHDMTGTYAKVDFNVTNHSSNIHKNLNSGANAQGYDSANKPCWACHGNGSATAHINDTYKAPKLCENCHINSSGPFGAPQVREHFRNGSDIKAASAANNTRSCLACHQNISEMRLANNDPDAGSFDADLDGVNGTGISAYHYGRKRPDLRSGINTSCSYCHQNISTAFENVMTNSLNKSIMEHTADAGANTSNPTLSCTGSKCHSSGLIHDTNLTKYTTQAWTPGGADYCAPCHKPGNASAAKYVYNQKHDPANSSGDRIGDCGFCHNASSQGMNGSTVRIHTPALTNTTSIVFYGTCTGCHNATSIFVGASKQIFSHLPNGSQYSGNTTMSNYSCENCHNMITGASMHSAGMDRSNGTCITCHFNRISPFNATVKIIETWDYSHTYEGQKTCNITQCHNASGAALGFHLDKYAGAVVADPERVNSIWSDRNNAGNGFTDTLYVDCIDCHREHNNSFPFNNTYPFDYSTNYSFNYEANHTGENKKIHSTSDSMDSCYNCHTDIPDIKNPQNRFKVHNVSIEPLLGGPACVSCHNKSAPTSMGYPPETRKVNHTAFNQSVHGKLVNYTLWNESKKLNSILLDSACWVCHSTNLTELPNNAHPDRGGPASLRPFQCNECHTPEGNVSMLDQEIFQRTPKIYQHYAGKSFIGEKIFNSTKGCYECHENSLVPKINISYGEYVRKGEANGSHYANRADLIKTNLTQLGCQQCHAVGASGGLNGMDYGNAISVPATHNAMGSTEVACQNSCHNFNPAISITNHNNNMGIYIGESSCYASGCHIPPTCEECTR